jgi:hypothetical protein
MPISPLPDANGVLSGLALLDGERGAGRRQLAGNPEGDPAEFIPIAVAGHQNQGDRRPTDQIPYCASDAPPITAKDGGQHDHDESEGRSQRRKFLCVGGERAALLSEQGLQSAAFEAQQNEAREGHYNDEDESAYHSISPTLRSRRALSAVMIRRLSTGVSRDHPAISSTERPHPVHSPEVRSKLHMPTQGVSMLMRRFPSDERALGYTCRTCIGRIRGGFTMNAVSHARCCDY